MVDIEKPDHRAGNIRRDGACQEHRAEIRSVCGPSPPERSRWSRSRRRTGLKPARPLLERAGAGLGAGALLPRGTAAPWNAYQVLIVGAIFLAAWTPEGPAGPRIRAWMASREGWPTWRMRILVVVHQRLRMIFFVMLVWLTVWIMREVTWPSRSYLLTIVAELATAGSSGTRISRPRCGC
jgi:hypothetical protein